MTNRLSEIEILRERYADLYELSQHRVLNHAERHAYNRLDVEIAEWEMAHNPSCSVCGRPTVLNISDELVCRTCGAGQPVAYMLVSAGN